MKSKKDDSVSNVVGAHFLPPLILFLGIVFGSQLDKSFDFVLPVLIVVLLAVIVTAFVTVSNLAKKESAIGKSAIFVFSIIGQLLSISVIFAFASSFAANL